MCPRPTGNKEFKNINSDLSDAANIDPILEDIREKKKMLHHMKVQIMKPKGMAVLPPPHWDL
uniref:Uncharacterized protein n=1 Tax=Romanomermis culicivorax TaxID=13658 RepID=A0A915HM39_ROMCU